MRALRRAGNSKREMRKERAAEDNRIVWQRDKRRSIYQSFWLRRITSKGHAIVNRHEVVV